MTRRSRGVSGVRHGKAESYARSDRAREPREPDRLSDKRSTCSTPHYSHQKTQLGLVTPSPEQREQSPWPRVIEAEDVAGNAYRRKDAADLYVAAPALSSCVGAAGCW